MKDFSVIDFDTIPFTHNTSWPPRFIMLVGIPGSGKTSKAKSMTCSDTIHVSSDAIREILYGDESCQDNPAKVFERMHANTLTALNHGLNVVYDATNITRKNRKQILEKLPAFVRKECIICWAPIDVCIERDRIRDRTVGKEVIDKMLRRFEAPYYDEGFDSIIVSTDGVYYDENQYYKNLIADIDIPHDNPHHSVGVLEHCYQAGVNLLDSEVPAVVVNAAFVHDIGKAYTKTFKNKKGEACDVAHYYDHQAVGAWQSYGINGNNPTLAWLISSHMAPFINQKYYDNLPIYMKRWLTALHAADKAAH